MVTISNTSIRDLTLLTALGVTVVLGYLVMTRDLLVQVFPWSTQSNVRGYSASVLNGSAERAGSSGVRVFSMDHYNCTHLLPFRLSDGNLSRICTYNPEEDYIAVHVKRDQGFESSLVQDVMRALRAAQHLLENETQAGDKTAKVSLVDLGSNIGVFTLTAASAGYEVLAVDAMKDTLQLLATSLHLAGLTSRVTILNNAISDVRGSVSMHVDKQNFGASQVKQNIGFVQDGDSEANIQAICINDLIPYVRSRHVVVKMDIEGFEERALWSASDFFEKLDVRFVLMEWNFHRGDSGPRIIHFMTRRGMLPYTDSTKMNSLHPNSYQSWPGNVVFMR